MYNISINNQKYEVELHYALGLSNATVSINFNRSYIRTIEAAMILEKELKNKIPFKYISNRKSKLGILGGKRVSNMLSVEIDLVYNFPQKDAIQKLETAGFQRGLELLK